MNTDVIVIGSGFGGSVVAARTAQAGLGTVVLERGGPLDVAHWNSINEGRAGLHRGTHDNGPLDIHAMRGLGALTGNALGGGSRIYTSVTIRPPPDIFGDSWPSNLDHATLAASYDRVESTIRPTPCPDTQSRVKWMGMLGQFLNFPVTRLPLAVDWNRMPASQARCDGNSSFMSELGDWFRGAGGMKRSLNQTYLLLAAECGAAIHTNASVRVIEPIAGGFRVWFDQLVDGDSRPGSWTARRVIVSAGTLNTLRLLFTNRDEHRTLPHISPQLGERFFTNGDRGALLLSDAYDWAADFAPPALAWFDRWDSHRFFMMDLGRSPLVRGPILRLLKKIARHPRGYPLKLRHEKHGAVALSAWIVGIMGAGEAPRRLTYSRSGHLRCTSNHNSDQSREDVVQASIDALANAAGASWLMVPAFLERRMPLTVHPLGGAVMADSPDLGVADSYGEVFGHPGLFIADGSLVPTPTGVPPSMTIAALAERVATRIMESAR